MSEAEDLDIVVRVAGNGPFSTEELHRAIALGRLGAVVLATLERPPKKGSGDLVGRPRYDRKAALGAIYRAARDLGLLPPRNDP